MQDHRGKLTLVALLTVVAVFAAAASGLAAATPQEQLGEMLYFDTALSEPDGQSCASCHDPAVGFDDPDDYLPVSEGVIPGLFGGRNSPISAYAMYAPPLHWDAGEELWFGGQFWDGRATGAALGDPLADQAIGPFLNPVEMANPDKETVIRDILNGPYAALFVEVCGSGNLNNWKYVEDAYNCVGRTIGTFERTQLFGQFSSKYDAYLQRCLHMGGLPGDCAQGTGQIAFRAGKMLFDREEWDGLQLFMGENDNDGVLEKGEGAMCSACHAASWTDPAVYAAYGLPVEVPAWAQGMIPPLFTDFSYDNLGVPKSDHYLLADLPVDLGLGPIVGSEDENGKFKVMTLRNIGASAPYLHNGFFDKLDDVVLFYSSRDVPEMMWPEPEYPDTVNFEELGNLGLSERDVAAVAAFMRTLTDGYKVGK